MQYGYARCSTNESLQDIDRQRRILIQKGVDKNNIFFEYISGAKENRPELTRLLKIVEPGDTIISLSVSRLARSTKQICDIIEFIEKNKLRLIVEDITVDCREKELNPMTEGMIKMMGVFAELDRKIISNNVKTGMANAKAKGSKLGRPKTSISNIPKQFLKYYELYRDKKINITELATLSELSRPTVYKYIKIIKG